MNKLSEVKTASELNETLADVLIKVRDGSIPNQSAKTIALLADKINKNNVNSINYKRITSGIEKIAFFEEA